MLQWCHFSINLRSNLYLQANTKLRAGAPILQSTPQSFINAHMVPCSISLRYARYLPANRKIQLFAKVAIISLSFTCSLTDLAETHTITIYKCFNGATSRSTCDLNFICQQIQRRPGAPLSQSFINAHMVPFLDQLAIWKTFASKQQEAVVWQDSNPFMVLVWKFLQEMYGSRKNEDHYTVYKCFNGAFRSTCQNMVQSKDKWKEFLFF